MGTRLIYVAALLMLGACGGSGGKPPPGPPEPGSRTASSLVLITAASSIPADGSSPTVITAIARDAGNRLLPDVKVDFAASSGGIAGSPAITNELGEASVQLSTASDATPRVITVTGTTTKNGLSYSVNVTVQ